MLEQLRRLRFYGFLTLLILPPALGCLWVLLARFELVPPVPGLLWWFSIVVAPWWLLAAGGFQLFKALLSYLLHRQHAQTERIEGATQQAVSPARLIRDQLIGGGGAVVLAAAVLVPRYTPDGVLLWESSAIERQPVMGTLRQEEGKMMLDYADQRVWTCHYLTTLGISTRVHVASRAFPYCTYFIHRYPRS